ncbi:hypothetical protein BOTBODRAFT_129656 [Botryobasidium botryosum FD-172 SS1]|uniref:Eukaryotic translation initiation factor 3 subunit H n=1 Tax=Botryobasidium botryosum (strain FD-172 SS1) TaxID=930990 RepID=A0A067MYY7_BOTB1|nr:hypothetical protein BOTBODRAFT_129656 [Botryobasidium botryosum FD-172 SS1]
MSTSMAAALAATLPATQSNAPTAPAPTASESIPPSMAKYVDIEAEIPITSVQLDGLVVMKIVKHGREAHPAPASGTLVGLDLDGKLEVSNSFPSPAPGEDEERAPKFGAPNPKYEERVLRSLKEVNSDSGVVGFYQTTTMGAFLTQSLVETQASNFEKLRHGGVVVVHDVTQASRGNAALRAFRMTPEFLEAHKKRKFDTQSLIDNRLTFSNILEEVPVVVRSSVLLSAFLSKLTQSPAAPPLPSLGITSTSTLSDSLSPTYSHLDLTSPTHLSRHMESIIDTLDLYKTEEGNLAYLSRQIARERTKADAYTAKRRDENAARVAQGMPPLPEEDVTRLFKIPPEPSRLDSMILLGQLDGYTKSLEASTGSGLVKMYAAQAGSPS